MTNRVTNGVTRVWQAVVPVTVVAAAIIVIWYVFTVIMNAPWAYDQAERADASLSFPAMVADTMSQKRPVLPAPHQVAGEIWDTTVGKKITSKRSLIYHGWITLSATLVGFGLGTALGVLLAVGIVYSRVMELSAMPWVIISQTIPILAIAPMIIVVLYNIGVSGLIAKRRCPISSPR